MISRVTADFYSEELAHLAMQRLRESVDYVYSAKVLCGRISGRSSLHNSVFLQTPSFFSSYTAPFSDTVNGTVSAETSLHSLPKQKATACIVCGSAAVDNVISVLNAMGGSNIRFAQ